MRITGVNVYRVELPLHEGSYKWSGGRSVEVFDSTVVELETDSGITGFGEVCPLGPAYLPAYAAGARTGIAELAPHLIGIDPTELNLVNQRMDQSLRGHPYVKSALDMACWDVLGKVCGQPLSTLLGGRYGEDFALYRAISQDTPERMAANVSKYRAEGYTKFQLKSGSDVETDIARSMPSRPSCSPAMCLWLTPTAGGRNIKRCVSPQASAMSMFTSSNRA